MEIVKFSTCPWTSTGLDYKINQHKIVKNFLPIIFSKRFGAQKNRLIQTVLLSTQNICFS